MFCPATLMIDARILKARLYPTMWGNESGTVDQVTREINSGMVEGVRLLLEEPATTRIFALKMIAFVCFCRFQPGGR